MYNRKHFYVGCMLNIGLNVNTADLYIAQEGLMFVSDWRTGIDALEYQG